jgi:uncharacterized protein YdeI (YjbR/CyaY-like superfamily)
MSPKHLPPDAVHPKSIAAWRAWLLEHHERDNGVWLVTYKKAAGIPDMSYDDAVCEALCFGWVDSKPRALDERRTMLWFAPRKSGSLWSLPNKQRVDKLMAAGRMHAAGLRKVEAAKVDGTWTALDAVEALLIPADLGEALAQYPDALPHFEAFPRSVKRGILEWILQAKTAPTRRKRVEETARLAAQNVRANQWRPS